MNISNDQTRQTCLIMAVDHSVSDKSDDIINQNLCYPTVVKQPSECRLFP